MKRILGIIFGIFFIFFVGYNRNIMGDEKKAENYIIAQDYNIIARKGEIKNYTLEKSMLYGSIRNLQYQQSWGVQKVKPDEYFGKHCFINKTMRWAWWFEIRLATLGC